MRAVPRSVIIVSLTLLALSCSAAVAGGAPPPPPRWVLQTSPTTSNLLDISCQSVYECMAVGTNATVIRTANGGRSWRVLHTGYGTAHPTLPFASVRCPVPDVCSLIAGKNVILHTTNGGRSWLSYTFTLPATLSQLGHLACPTRRICFATASPSGNPFSWFTHSAAIYRTTDGNVTWYQVTIPMWTLCPGDCGTSKVGYDLQWISCQNDRSCYAGGITFIGSHEGYASTVLRTTNSGTTWAQVSQTYAVNVGTCPTTLICTGIYYEPQTPNYGPTLERTTNGGQTWKTKDISPVMTAIACSGSTFCALAGPHGKLATTSGMTLKTEASPTSRNLNAVACPRAGICYAVGAKGTIVSRKSP
jgi:photosystem II stability/assembly factor-like uncharacterized protein